MKTADEIRTMPGVEFFTDAPSWEDSTILKRRIADGRLIIVNQMFGFTQLALGPPDGLTWAWGYRYEQPFAAVLAALIWEPIQEQHPSLGWHTAIGPGGVRLGPDGEPQSEDDDG